MAWSIGQHHRHLNVLSENFSSSVSQNNSYQMFGRQFTTDELC